jgi:hypothetical protein
MTVFAVIEYITNSMHMRAHGWGLPSPFESCNTRMRKPMNIKHAIGAKNMVSEACCNATWIELSLCWVPLKSQ